MMAYEYCPLLNTIFGVGTGQCDIGLLLAIFCTY